MPYITKDRRKAFTSTLEEFETALHELDIVPGDLNYLVTSMMHKYLEVYGMNYQNVNNIMGLLEGVKLEMYRKKAADYEDLKEKQNGKVN